MEIFMAKIKTGVGSFRKGHFYRRKDNPSVVKHIHSKPLDYFRRQNLLVTLRMPTSTGSYIPVMCVAPSVNPDEWGEINKEVFEAAMAGKFDPSSKLIMSNANQEIVDEFWEEKDSQDSQEEAEDE
jgi:hypothetical protein